MSIERELLEKVISGDNKGDFFVSYDLYKEIYKFLAQPEDGIEAEILPSEVWFDGYEAGKRSASLSKKPEQEPVGIVRTIGGYPDNSEHVVDWVCKYKDLKEGDRLYLAPPKRDPLSEEAVCQILLKKEWKGFVELVRMVEKAHGIGGGE